MKRSSGQKVVWVSSLLFCILFGLFIYGAYVEPSLLGIRHIWVNDDQMGSILQNKVVVQISDIHLGKVGVDETTLLKAVETLQPDLVFLTGDYVRWNGEYEAALDFLAKVKARDGVWAVMGDYDYSNSRKSCLFCHEPDTGKPTTRHNVKFLRNSSDKIDIDTRPIWIVGLDREAGGESFAEKGLSIPEETTPVLVLSHSPLVFDMINDNQDVLVLAGDTHGGQIPLPAWLWSLFGYEKNARYEQGLFTKGRKRMYVTRGVGTSHFPIRLLRPPEITVFHFQKPANN